MGPNRFLPFAGYSFLGVSPPSAPLPRSSAHGLCLFFSIYIYIYIIFLFFFLCMHKHIYVHIYKSNPSSFSFLVQPPGHIPAIRSSLKKLSARVMSLSIYIYMCVCVCMSIDMYIPMGLTRILCFFFGTAPWGYPPHPHLSQEAKRTGYVSIYMYLCVCIQIYVYISMGLAQLLPLLCTAPWGYPPHPHLSQEAKRTRSDFVRVFGNDGVDPRLGAAHGHFGCARVRRRRTSYGYVTGRRR